MKVNNSFLSYEELENIGFKRLGGGKRQKGYGYFDQPQSKHL